MGASRNMNWTRSTPTFTVRVPSDPDSKSRELVRINLLEQDGLEPWVWPRVKRPSMFQSLYVLFMNFLRDPYGFSDVIAS